MKDEPVIYLTEWYDCGENDVVYVGHDFIEAWEALKHYKKDYDYFDEISITSYKGGKWVEMITLNTCRDTFEYDINTKK